MGFYMSKEKTKQIFDSAHAEVLRKTLNLDEWLHLSALFNSFDPAQLLQECYVLFARLPQATIDSLKSMEKAMDHNTVMFPGGAQPASIEE